MIDTTTDPLAALNWINTYARLPQAFWERRAPDALPDPHLVASNAAVGALLGLDAAGTQSASLLAFASGNHVPAGCEPIATVYSGHQFGVWAGQLGDGRAILMGEVQTPSGHFEVQLKGAGATAYSRFGDGRAVLRSSIREYLASEAMAALRIPTTRALAIAGSALPVLRESVETAAVVVRVAPSFVRFGTFEHFASRNEPERVRQLADYVIAHDYPHLLEAGDDERYVRFYDEVVDRTARLMAQWTAVGFAHGVMNTDNMSILGLTLDYGPYGFLDAYEPGLICNHSDEGGRYAFDAQPSVGRWNCAALARALASLVPTEAARMALERFESIFHSAYLAAMCAKAGLTAVHEGDPALLGDLMALLERSGADYARFFRALANLTLEPQSQQARLARARPTSLAAVDPASLILADEAGGAWFARYRTRLASDQSDDDARRARMNAVNPAYVLRNYLAQDAIEAAERRDFTPLSDLFEAICAPYEERPQFDRYAIAPPERARSITVSCSS